MFHEMLSNLNNYQLQAVRDDSSACLVNAHVGSGKTTVLIAKIFYLHKVKNISFKNMVVLTFTNKAADEIKDRIKKSDESIDEKEMPFFGTFHSVALNMLKTILPVEGLGYTQDFTVIDPDEETDMANRLIATNSLRVKYRNKLYKRLELAEQRQSLYGNMKYEDDIQTLAKWMQQERIKQNRMNFNDLLVNATNLAKKVEYRPQWIIVDEFQDSNEIQLELIRALAGEQTKIFAVGDPNQIIYSWRGSKRNLFSSFKKDFRAKELSLPINYRSCNTILEVAKCFLVSDSDLSGLREQGSKITIRNHYNPFNEAQYLCDRIIEIVSEGNQYKDIAILYRLQRQSNILEVAFNKSGIPFEMSIRRTLKDIPVLDWFINLIRLSINNNDMESAINVFTNSSYGESFSHSEIRDMFKNGEFKQSVLYNKILGFAEWCKSCESALDLNNYFEIDNYINPTSASFSEDKQYIMSLLDKIDTHIKQCNIEVLEGIKTFIDSSALYGTDILEDDDHMDGSKVKLMTLHASKGLEFKYVFIIGANFGLIPLHTKTAKEEDEERRLFFVGITRAKDFLEISYYTNPENPRVAAGASRYLQMIPDHLAERDEMSGGNVDLQALRREVVRAKDQKPPQIVGADEERRVQHHKYGVGIVMNDNEEMVTVLFDGYGEKEFLKAFSELEDI